MISLSILGGGLAGSEAAWQLARRGIRVTLYEMKPTRFSPAHHSAAFAELVCSNSFGSEAVHSAAGMLQSELAALDSLIVAEARAHRVPAGRALAVDREAFSASITERLESLDGIRIVREEVVRLPEERPLIICTGPLTSDALAADLQARLGCDHLYFYDAVSPIVLGDSIDMNRVFRASRHDDGPGDYLNAPMTEEEYYHFIDELVSADQYPGHDFEDIRLFHGCQPIEAMARSGPRTLAFGPMRPVGLEDPRTGRRPFAVVQLRREDRDGRLWSLVGFQTRLRHGEQARVLRLIPGLEEAEFVRLGSIHRNTYLNAPALLTEEMALRAVPGVYCAGQITGVEGYLESSASGLIVARFLEARMRGWRLPLPPPESMLGGLLRHLREASPKNFQPMNSNFGLLPRLEGRAPKAVRRARMAERGAKAFARWVVDIREREARHRAGEAARSREEPPLREGGA